MAIMLLLLGYNKVVSNIICTIVSSVTFVLNSASEKSCPLAVLYTLCPLYWLQDLDCVGTLHELGNLVEEIKLSCIPIALLATLFFLYCDTMILATTKYLSFQTVINPALSVISISFLSVFDNKHTSIY